MSVEGFESNAAQNLPNAFNGDDNSDGGSRCCEAQAAAMPAPLAEASAAIGAAAAVGKQIRTAAPRRILKNLSNEVDLFRDLLQVLRF